MIYKKLSDKNIITYPVIIIHPGLFFISIYDRLLREGHYYAYPRGKDLKNIRLLESINSPIRTSISIMRLRLPLITKNAGKSLAQYIIKAHVSQGKITHDRENEKVIYKSKYDMIVYEP